MEAVYRRDLNHNYMILENETITGNEYMIRMVEKNDLPELLKFQLRRMNGKSYLYYEITSRQPITQVYEKRDMRSRDIEQLLTGIKNALDRAHQYLLSSGDILLDPEFIYMNVDTGQIQVCYAPCYEEGEQKSFLALAEFILKRLDHADRRAVDLGYGFFGEVSKENFSLLETLKILLKERPVKKEAGRKNQRSGKTFSITEVETEEVEEDDWTETDDEREWQTVADEEGGGEGDGWWENPSSQTKGRRNKGRRDKGIADKGTQNKGGWDKSAANEDIRNKGRRNKSAANKNIWNKSMQNESRKDKRNKKDADYNKERNKRTLTGKEMRLQKKKRRNLLLCAGIVAVVMMIFAATVYLARLDLTQTGGLAFLLLALLWIAYSIAEGRKEKKKKHWMEDDLEDEEEFEEELFAELYHMETEGERKTAEETKEAVEAADELCGETRCLTEQEFEKPLYLISLEPEFYPDIVMHQGRAVLGKKKDQADIWLKLDCISRIHAKLEKSNGNYYITDLNSMNGTFVNGERLKPKEQRQIYPGDQISLATMHYKIKK